MKKDLRKAFGKVIKDLRRDQGLTQQALADFAGVTREYISHLERGQYYPTLNVIYSLAKILKVKPGDLIQKVDKILNL